MLQAISLMPGNFNILCPGNPSVLKNGLNLFQDFFHQTTLHLYDLCKSVDLQICKWGSYCSPEVLTWQVKNKKKPWKVTKTKTTQPQFRKGSVFLSSPSFFSGENNSRETAFRGGKPCSPEGNLEHFSLSGDQGGGPKFGAKQKNQGSNRHFLQPWRFMAAMGTQNLHF